MSKIEFNPKISVPSPLSITRIGVGLAIGISWQLNHSVLWAVLHGLINWIYVGYKAAPWVASHLGIVLR